MTAWPSTNIKFADDTTVVGLVTNNDETAYREEVRDLSVWCQDNNLSLKLRASSRLRALSSLVSTSPTNYHGPNTSRQS
jgi:hypothetical protein